MNKIAANPLMITTGEYRLMESSTAGQPVNRKQQRPRVGEFALDACPFLNICRESVRTVDATVPRPYRVEQLILLNV
jgi:hypothetical protein